MAYTGPNLHKLLSDTRKQMLAGAMTCVDSYDIKMACTRLGLTANGRSILTSSGITVLRYTTRMGKAYFTDMESGDRAVVESQAELARFLGERFTPDSEPIATPKLVAAPKPIAQPSRPKQAIQRDLFGNITSVRSLTPKPQVQQLSLI